jgi:acyl-coenzyme A thioesterase PaaI-like protein
MTVAASAGTIELCHGCRPLGRCRFGVDRLWLDDDKVLHATVRCPEAEQAGPGVAHGGWMAAVFDDVLGRYANQFDVTCVTVKLEVEYLKPVAVESDLEVTVTLERRDGRKWFVAGEMRLAASGAVLARATAFFLETSPDHFDRHRAWMADQTGKTEGPAA